MSGFTSNNYFVKGPSYKKLWFWVYVTTKALKMPWIWTVLNIFQYYTFTKSSTLKKQYLKKRSTIKKKFLKEKMFTLNDNSLVNLCLPLTALISLVILSILNPWRINQFKITEDGWLRWKTKQGLRGPRLLWVLDGC